MNETVSITILLWTEALLYLQCLEVTFRKTIPLNRHLFLLLCASYVVYGAINFGNASRLWAALVYLFYLVFCFHTFQESLPATFLKGVAGFLLCGFLESACIIGVILLFPGLPIKAAPTPALLIALILARCLRIISLKRKKKADRRHVWAATILYGVVCLYLAVDYYVYSKGIKVYSMALLAFVLFAGLYLEHMEEVHRSLEKKTCELQLQKAYEETFEEVLKGIWRRQHDHKNQLGAIRSMHLAAGSLEELIGMQEAYMEGLLAQAGYDALALSCHNRTLSCYLYTRICACEGQGIHVEHTIGLGHACCGLGIHEMIEILGILFDNACESLLSDGIEPAVIRFSAREGEGKVIFSMANPVTEISADFWERMFEEGYSSKGEDRGLGLARVKELIDLNGGRIVAEEKREETQYWVSLTVEMN